MGFRTMELYEYGLDKGRTAAEEHALPPYESSLAHLSLHSIMS